MVAANPTTLTNDKILRDVLEHGDRKIPDRRIEKIALEISRHEEVRRDKKDFYCLCGAVVTYGVPFFEHVAVYVLSRFRIAVTDHNVVHIALILKKHQLDFEDEKIQCGAHEDYTEIMNSSPDMYQRHFLRIVHNIHLANEIEEKMKAERLF